MTNTVDNRVVQLEFDNKQFESATKTTLGSLEKLKQSLKLDEAVKGLSNVSGAIGSINLGNLSDGVSQISAKFSALDVISFTVLQNITNWALQAGKSLIDMAIGIQSIKGGFAEYEQGLTTFQTILANTASAGATIDDVNKAMADMNKYANLTVYSYGDMSRAMGTFTANGVKLNDSVLGIKGLFNIISLTGGDANKANMAVQQLSQAIASGAVKLQDWQSVVSAGFAGPDFQNQLIQTARVHGIAVDGMIAKEGSFRESLKDGWLTSQVLLETLGQYGNAYSADQLKSMGYTDAQIKQILELGQRATDTATKLKSFTQLIDMLKSNMVTGWATSFKLVIGDLTEATDLWSAIGDFLGGILQKSADVRNEMLQTFKDLGGREALVAGLKNILTSLGTVIKLVSDAFEFIFPPVTGTALAGIAKGFQALTSIFVINSDKADKLKTIFKGIFSIFDIVGMTIGKLVGGFARLVGGLSVKIPGGGILQLLSNAASWITYFRDLIKYGDLFGKTYRAIAVALAPTIAAITQFANIMWARVEPIIKTVGDAIGRVVTRFGDFNSLLQEGFTPIEAVGEILKSLLPPNLSPAIDTITTALQNFGLAVSQIDLKPFITFLGSLKDKAVIGFTWAIQELGKGISGILNVFGTVGTKVSEFFSGFSKGVSDNIGKVDIGKSVGNIGQSILDWIKKINWRDVANVLATGLIGALILSIKQFIDKGGSVFEGFSGILGSVQGILDGVRDSLKAWQEQLKAKVLMTIATAIAILAASLIALSLVDKDKLANALSVITLLFVDLMASMSSFNKTVGAKDTAKISAELMALAGSVALLTLAVVALSYVDPQRVTQGLLSVGAILAELAGFILIINKTKLDPASLAGLIGLSVALLILAGAVAVFGIIDPVVLSQGLLSVGEALAGLAAFMLLIKDTKFGPADATGILIMSGALIVIALAVEKFGSLDPTVLQNGLLSVTAILAALTAFIMGTGNAQSVLQTSVGLVLIAASMLIFAAAISQLGSLPLDTIYAGLGTMAAVLGEIVLATMGMEGALPGAFAILVVAGALLLLIPTVSALGALDLETIGKALLALAGVFTVLGIAGYLLTPVAPTLVILGAAIALMGLGALMAGIGLLALATGLGALVAVGYGSIQALNTIFTTVAQSLANAIVVFAQTIAAGAPILMDALAFILKTLLDHILQMVPSFAEAALELVQTLLDELNVNLPRIVQSGMDLIVALLKGISDNITKVVDVVIDIVTNFLDAIAERLPDIIQSGYNLLLSFIDGITKAIDDPQNQAKLQKSALALGDAIIKGAINGINVGVQLIVEAAKAVGEAAINAIKAILGIKSPSKVFYEFGKLTDQGFANGLTDYASRVKYAAIDVGQKAISGIGEAISNIDLAVSDSMDVSPTIRPIVDLSNVVSGGKQIDNILGNRSLNLSASASRARAIGAQGFSGNDLPSQTQSPTAGTSIQLTQNNYSPKALDRIDIYRQTRNQLSSLKELVKNR